MPNPFTCDFDAFVDEARQRWRIPGIAFAIVDGDATYLKGYGDAQLDPKVAVDNDTLFFAASTTKAHLCAAWEIYIRSDTNKSKPKDVQISWTTPISRIIPEDFVLSDGRTSQVTLEDCVSHRTGLAPHNLSYGFGGVRTAREIVRNMRHLPLRTELRSEWEYCNTPFVAASHALELVTGQRLADFLRESFWGPAGMHSTYGGLGEATKALKQHEKVLAKPNMSAEDPSDPDWDKAGLGETDYFDGDGILGAGWIITSVSDYAKYMRAWLHAESGPLTAEMIKELWKPRTVVPAGDIELLPVQGISAYALGWNITQHKEKKIVYHPGALFGAGSLVALLPESKRGIAVFANCQDASIRFSGMVAALIASLEDPAADLRKEAMKMDEPALKLYRSTKEKFATASRGLYPDALGNVTVSHALPLVAYAGAYQNAGYGRMTLVAGANGDALIWRMTDRHWNGKITLTHVKAEHWLAVLTGLSPFAKAPLKARSEIGFDGKVRAWLIAIERSMPETMIRFERV